MDEYVCKYHDLSSEKKEELGSQYIPIKFAIKEYDYDKFYNATSDEDHDDEDYNNSDEFMSSLEGGEEEIKEGKGLKI